MSVFFPQSQPGGETQIVDRAAQPTNTNWWIDSATGASATGYGGAPGSPLAALAYAMTNATALGIAAKDSIYLQPGHNEGIADAQISIALAGLRVIGHPSAVGSLRPTFDFDHANAEITISANDVMLKNLCFRPSVTGVLIGVEIADGVTGTVFEDCEWMIGEDGAGVDEFVKGVRMVSGNHDVTFRRCKLLSHASAGQSTHAIHVDAASNRLTLDGVVVDGPWATGGVVEDAAGTEHVVVNCAFDVTGTNYSFNGGSTFSRRTGNYAAGAPEDTGANFIGADNNNNTVATTNVVANADGSLLERNEYVISQISGLPSVTGIGSTFLVTKTIAQAAVVAAGAALTGASANGAILIEDVVIQNGATAADSAGHAAVVELYTDNAAGSGSFVTDAQAKISANAVVSGATHTTKNQVVLETGKIVSIKATTEDLTSGGTLTVHLICRRLAAGASLAAA